MGFSLFRDDCNNGALAFYTAILSGRFAMQNIAAPGSWAFLSYAAIFVLCWANKNWWSGVSNKTAVCNYVFALALARAWQWQVSDANVGAGGAVVSVEQWTLVFLTFIPFVRNFLKNVQ